MNLLRCSSMTDGDVKERGKNKDIFVHYKNTSLQLGLFPTDTIQLQDISNLHTMPSSQLLTPLLLPSQPLKQEFTPLILIPAQLQQMHLIRPIHNPHCATLGIHISKWGILTDTRTAISLDSAVDDFESHCGHEDFGFGDLFQGEFGVFGVDCYGGVEDGEAGCVDFDAGARDALDHYTVLVQQFAKGLFTRVVEAGDEELEGFLGLVGVVSI